MLRIVAVFYFITISWIVVDCQPDSYILQKVTYDSHPNEQPFLLLGRKQSHPAVPKFLDGIPQIEHKVTEEIVVSCPEQFAPGEIAPPVIHSVESASAVENNPDPLAAGGEDSQIGHTMIFPSKGSLDTPTNVETGQSSLAPVDESENQSTPVGSMSDTLHTIQSSSTFDSIPTSHGESFPRMSGIDEAQEPVEEPILVQQTVTKKKAKFYAKDIRFRWQLPYLKCSHPAQVFVRQVTKPRKGKTYEVEPCEDNGEKYEIGFWVKAHKSFMSTLKSALGLGKKRQSNKKEYEWHPLITVCFNMHEWRPVYTKHTLYGSAVKAAAKLLQRPNNFDYEESFRPSDKVDPWQFYDREIQYKLFVSIFGEDLAYTYNDTVSKFLIPLQLVAPAEMPTPVSTLVTYSYMNTTPSWEVVALRNWRILGDAVLSFADEKKLDLVVYSGTANILQLKGIDGAFEDIRLNYHGNTLAVAKVLFKLVHNEHTNEAIIFFVFNNPYVSDSSNQVCVDACVQSGWGNGFWKNLDRGYTACCHYNDVKHRYDSIPRINVDNLSLLINDVPRREPILVEIDERDEPVESESGFTEASDVLDLGTISRLNAQTGVREITLT